MTYRDDISDWLVHFVSSSTDGEAFDVLRTILDEGRLRGSGKLIKGGYPCVCFTEAPLDKIGPTVAEAAVSGLRYKPFGIVVRKDWLYGCGGRPVIYGPPSDFEDLPDSLRWRYMRFEPTSTPRVDFTWEREWRVRTDTLAISPDVADIIVSNEEYANRLARAHDAEQSFEVEQIRQSLGDSTLAEQYREPFPWEVYRVRQHRRAAGK
jgi:hypothetical protein